MHTNREFAAAAWIDPNVVVPAESDVAKPRWGKGVFVDCGPRVARYARNPGLLAATPRSRTRAGLGRNGPTFARVESRDLQHKHYSASAGREIRYTFGWN